MHFRVRVGARIKTTRCSHSHVCGKTKSRVPACYFLEFTERERIVVVDKMAEPEPEQAKLDTFASFAYLLSPLILRALADLSLSRPTRVQQQAIPLALENRDVLARAPTGSGKTAAYCIPLVQKILNAQAVGTLHRGGTIIPSTSFVFYPLLFLYRILHSRLIRERAQEHSFWYRLASSRNKFSII
jgi:superfamily II DNA helicase RecQ